MKILATLHLCVAVDYSSLVGLISEAFRWIFDHGDGVFACFEVVSMYGCVGYQVMNQHLYYGID